MLESDGSIPSQVASTAIETIDCYPSRLNPSTMPSSLAATKLRKACDECHASKIKCIGAVISSSPSHHSVQSITSSSDGASASSINPKGSVSDRGREIDSDPVAAVAAAAALAAVGNDALTPTIPVGSASSSIPSGSISAHVPHYPATTPCERCQRLRSPCIFSPPDLRVRKKMRLSHRSNGGEAAQEEGSTSTAAAEALNSMQHQRQHLPDPESVVEDGDAIWNALMASFPPFPTAVDVGPAVAPLANASVGDSGTSVGGNGSSTWETLFDPYTPLPLQLQMPNIDAQTLRSDLDLHLHSIGGVDATGEHGRGNGQATMQTQKSPYATSLRGTGAQNAPTMPPPPPFANHGHVHGASNDADPHMQKLAFGHPPPHSHSSAVSEELVGEELRAAEASVPSNAAPTQMHMRRTQAALPPLSRALQQAIEASLSSTGSGSATGLHKSICATPTLLPLTLRANAALRAAIQPHCARHAIPSDGDGVRRRVYLRSLGGAQATDGRAAQAGQVDVLQVEGSETDDEADEMTDDEAQGQGKGHRSHPPLGRRHVAAPHEMLEEVSHRSTFMLALALGLQIVHALQIIVSSDPAAVEPLANVVVVDHHTESGVTPQQQQQSLILPSSVRKALRVGIVYTQARTLLRTMQDIQAIARINHQTDQSHQSMFVADAGVGCVPPTNHDQGQGARGFASNAALAHIAAVLTTKIGDAPPELQQQNQHASVGTHHQSTPVPMKDCLMNMMAARILRACQSLRLTLRPFLPPA